MHLDINMHMYMYILELLGGYRQYGKVRDGWCSRGPRKGLRATAYAYRHSRVELQLVVRLGLDSHHWLLVTEPTLEVRAVWRVASSGAAVSSRWRASRPILQQSCLSCNIATCYCVLCLSFGFSATAFGRLGRRGRLGKKKLIF